MGVAESRYENKNDGNLKYLVFNSLAIVNKYKSNLKSATPNYESFRNDGHKNKT